MNALLSLEKNKIIIKDFYSQISGAFGWHFPHIYSDIDGITTRRVPNPYNGEKCTCGNVYIWLYNNPHQPHAAHQGSRLVSYIDDSGANKPSVLGSMKEIWKQYEKMSGVNLLSLEDIDMHTIEDEWWHFYYTNHYKEFNKGVDKFYDYLQQKHGEFSAEELKRESLIFPSAWRLYTIEAVACYMQYLVRVSAFGFMMETILGKAMVDLFGGEWVESNEAEEKKGIDGHLILDGHDYPICLKPESFHGGVSPVYEERMVYYNKQRKTNYDLVFEFRTGADVLCVPFK